MTKKQIKKATEKRMRRILNDIKEKAYAKIDKALSSGSIADDSDFLKDNDLLAMAILEDVYNDHTIKTTEYRKEAENIQRFI